ncbi:MAG TPA: NAD-dependent epimerase/dehydratase family protein [Steroidobacteraceae bacterium]
MRILVTGSSGFIARFLIPELAATGHEVVGIDTRTGPEYGDFFSFVRANILDDDAVDRAMQQVDLVVHLAAEHKDFGVSETLYHQVNVDGTDALLRGAANCGVRKFVFFSSVAVYGDSLTPTHEELTPAPDSPYGKTKLLAERRVEEWVKSDRAREVVIVRPTVVFGPWNYANMYRLVDAVAKRRYISVGNGKNIKSVGYVENVTGATLFLIDRMKPGIQLYNYADSPHLSTRELVRSIAATLQVSVPFIRIPKAMALAAVFPFDLVARATGTDLPLTAKRIDKFTRPTHHLAERIRAVGYEPPYRLEEGIRKTVAWYMQVSGERRQDRLDG